MPHAKFDSDPLKTVAVYKEQRNRQTNTHTHTHTHTYIYSVTDTVVKLNKLSCAARTKTVRLLLSAFGTQSGSVHHSHPKAPHVLDN